MQQLLNLDKQNSQPQVQQAKQAQQHMQLPVQHMEQHPIFLGSWVLGLSSSDMFDWVGEAVASMVNNLEKYVCFKITENIPNLAIKWLAYDQQVCNRTFV